MRTGFNSCFLLLLFPSPLLLPPLFYSAARTTDRTDPASVSATATTIGRRKEERGRDKEDRKEEAGGQEEEIDAREQEGHLVGDVSEVTLASTPIAPRPSSADAGCRFVVVRGGDPGDSLNAEAEAQ